MCVLQVLTCISLKSSKVLWTKISFWSDQSTEVMNIWKRKRQIFNHPAWSTYDFCVCMQHFQIWRYSKGLISVLCSCPCASLRLNGRWLETAPWLRETESVDIIHQAAAAGRTLMQGWSAGGLIRPHPAQVWPREWRVQPEAENIHQRRHVKGKDSIAPSSCGQMNHNYCGNCLFYFRMREIDTREDTFVIKRNNECLFSRFILITSLKQSWWGWVLWLFDEMTSMSVTLM